MDPMAAALALMAIADGVIDLVNKIKNNADSTGNRELTADERAQLDARIAGLKDRAHWKPSTPS